MASDSLQEVRRGITSSNSLVRVVSARTLASLKTAFPQAQNALADLLRVTDCTVQHLAIDGLLLSSTLGAYATDALVALIEDESAHTVMRGYAALVAGRAADADSVLSKRSAAWLVSHDTNVVYGIVRGLLGRDKISVGHVEQVVALLRSAEERTRFVVLMELGSLRSELVPVMQPLVEHIGKETSNECVVAHANALAAIGHSVVPALLAVTKRQRVPEIVVAVGALGKIDDKESLDMMAEFLRNEQSETLRVWMLTMFRAMNTRARHAIPVLVDMLERETDQELLAEIVAVLEVIGHFDGSIAPGLVRCVLFGDEHLATVATSCVLKVGEAAVPLVTRVVKEANANERTRALKLLRLLWGRAGRLRRCAAIKEKEWLVTFFFVGTLLREYGKTSFRDMERRLRADQLAGDLDVKFHVGYKTLANHVEALQKALGKRLLTHYRGRAGVLTEEGLALLEEVEIYLAE